VNIREALRDTTRALRNVADDLAAREAEEIIERLLGVDRTTLYLDSQRVLTFEQREQLRRTVAARNTQIPLAYVLQKKYFHSVDLDINPGALIPRPDTEVLVEAILAGEERPDTFFLDLCTGPGTIAAALLARRPAWTGIASDISIAALHLAAMNLPRMAQLVCGDLGEAFKSAGGFDFIACNPPYISKTEMAQLDKSVIDFEPHIALDGGADGLEFYRRISTTIARLLKPEARLYLEIGATQQEAVSTLLRNSGWKDISFLNDLALRPRVVIAMRPDV
jgi:release factor glutamine methyltransferase